MQRGYGRCYELKPYQAIKKHKAKQKKTFVNVEIQPSRIVDGYDDVPWHMRVSTRDQHYVDGH